MNKNKLFIFTLLFISIINVCSQTVFSESQVLINNNKYREALDILLKADNGAEKNYLVVLCYLNLIADEDISYVNRNQLFSEMVEYYSAINNLKVEADLNEKINEELIQKKFILQNQGISFYNEKKLKSAFSVMEIAYFLGEKSGTSDTTLAYNISIIANEQNDIPNTIKYLEICIKEGIKRKEVFLLLIDNYKTQKEENKFYKTLIKAGEYYPQDMHFIREEINYYMERKKYDLALSKIEGIIEKGINDIELMLLKATLHVNTGEAEKAEEIYKQIIETDNNNIQAYYFMGALNLDNAILYQDIKSVSNEYMQKAKLYLEKANNIDSRNIEVLQSLSQLYSLTGEFDKFEVVKKQLDLLQ